jgi:shikimate dehydrogenase
MSAPTPLAAVLGDPIGHSRSPRLHAHWLARYGLRGHYVPLHVRPADLAETLALLPRLAFVGCNVTIPHKEAALAMAGEADPTARRIGAANTLTFRHGTIMAENTDAHGFLANLRQGAPGWDAGRPAVLLGAGGAARAAAVALLDAGVPEIRVVNRTLPRARALEELDDRITAVEWSAVGDALRGASLLANTTSLGMTGQPPLEIDLRTLPDDAVVTDAVYAPLVTPLLAAAAERGLATVDGLGMLLHQAAPGFARWFGRMPEVDEALRRAVLA